MGRRGILTGAGGAGLGLDTGLVTVSGVRVASVAGEVVHENIIQHS